MELVMPKYTNNDLAKMIEDISDRLKPVEDYVIILKDREERGVSSKDVPRSKSDWAGVVKQGFIVIGTALSIISALVVAFIQLMQGKQ
ncbi:hypothetical protein [Mycobacteroides abscessus]|uniref:hypothetical protein n=1 Tax=Mycobacteroides abscessus TaxID=36809 RepID=UPI000C261A95|nr:hypothetical protein [Mycobacteroides abscessus]